MGSTAPIAFGYPRLPTMADLAGWLEGLATAFVAHSPLPERPAAGLATLFAGVGEMRLSAGRSGGT